MNKKKEKKRKKEKKKERKKERKKKKKESNSIMVREPSIQTRSTIVFIFLLSCFCILFHFLLP